MSNFVTAASQITLDHDAQSALTAVQQRLQFVRQRLDQGDIDIARMLMDIDDIDDQLSDGIAFVSTLRIGLIYEEDAGGAIAVGDG